MLCGTSVTVTGVEVEHHIFNQSCLNYGKYRESIVGKGIAVEEWAKSTGGIWLENMDVYHITDFVGVASYGRFSEIILQRCC